MPQTLFANVTNSLKILRKELYPIVELTWDYKKDIDEIIENLNIPLLIMVMGEFSTGKSTFINALVEKEIAIVKATSTTAVITKLCYGLEDKIIVYFLNGSSKEYSADDFSKLTVEDESTEKLREKIDYVERALPLEILKNMTIIDSPGLNSLKKSHETTTRRFMDKSDTVIWLFDAHDSCKQTEIDAMKKLNPRLLPLVIVNKMDTLDEEESPEETLSNVSRKLRNNRLEFQGIIGISAKMAYQGKIKSNEKMIAESNIGEFYNKIDTVILPHREEYKRNTMFDSLAQIIFDVGTVISNKKSDNAKQKDKDYAAYIETEETLAGATDALESVLEDFLGFFNLSRNTFADEQVNKMKLNAAERSVFGVLYWLGLVADRNTEIAQKYLEAAAVRSDTVAQKILAEICEQSGQKDKAKYWWDRLGIKKPTKNTSKTAKPKQNKSLSAKKTSQNSSSAVSYGRNLVKTENDELSSSEKRKILIDKLKQPGVVLNPSNSVKIQPKSDDVFRIVVTGEFSRGKSTFVNALLGQRLLPTNQRPTTAIPTIIKYGDTLEYKVYRKGDNASLKISQDEFFFMEHSFDNDENLLDFSFIDHAEISCPLPFCKDNVEIVDTPGTNDINFRRMEITYNYINTADIIIIMLSALQPPTYSEMQFIKTMFHNHKEKNMFFLISFRDHMIDDKDNYESLIEDRTRRLQINLPNFTLQNRVFLVDNRGALNFHRYKSGERVIGVVPTNFNDTGFPAVEKALKDLIYKRHRTVKYDTLSISTISKNNGISKWQQRGWS